MKVHLTGGRGFLAGYVRAALEGEHEVGISDLEEVDVTDLEATLDGLSGDVDLVCHLAGRTGARASTESPDRFFEVNSTGTLNVLEACRRHGIPGIVFMSTLTVHGAADEPIHESSPLLPRHPYAASKAAAEMMLATYARSFGIRSAILRATLVAGEGQVEPNAISEFAEVALADGVIDIYGSGEHQREWLHPEDLARAVAAAAGWVERIDAPTAGRFIVSSGAPVSMRELAERIVARVGLGRITFSHPTAQAFSLTTGSNKAREVLGWEPRLDLDDIIDRVVGDLGG